MNTVWDSEKLKVFVKNTLGCTCPDEVFEKIQVGKCLVDGVKKEITRIVIGDTLLIYIISRQSGIKIVNTVDLIAMAGKTDRDTNHYNRYRMVVAKLEDIEQQVRASEHFSKTYSADEKMHIHFVDQELVDTLQPVIR